MPVIPATVETEIEESLELRRWRLQGAEISSLYSSLGDRVRLHLKKKKERDHLIKSQHLRCNEVPAWQGRGSEAWGCEPALPGCSPGREGLVRRVGEEGRPEARGR